MAKIAYAGVSNKAKKIKQIYAGATVQEPIYSNTTYDLNTSNLSKFFTVENGTGATNTQWSYSNYTASSSSSQITFSYNTYTQFFTPSGIGSSNTTWQAKSNGTEGCVFTPNNIGIDSTTATLYLTAKQSCNMSIILWTGTSEQGYDKLTVKVGSTTYANGVSGSISGLRENISLSANDIITLTYVKDSSQSASGEKIEIAIFIDPITINTGTTTLKGLKLVPNNIGVHSSDSVIILTAKQNITNLCFYTQYYTESGYDFLYSLIGDNIIFNGVSGSQDLYAVQTGLTLSQGDRMEFRYHKDSSGNASGEANTFFAITCDSIQSTTQTGTQTVSNVAKKVTKIYIGENNKAKLIYNAGGFSYTGTFEQTQVTLSGVNYNLYTLKSTGVLSVEEGARFWMCGGGQAGEDGIASASSDYGQGGFGGSGGHFIDSLTDGYSFPAGQYTVQIGLGGTGSGAKGGSTTISNSNGATIATALGGGNTKNYGSVTAYGGSGGGAGGYAYGGGAVSSLAGRKGCGKSTIPFGIESLSKHCAGGGGGRVSYKPQGSSSFITDPKGGSGGSNGGNGGTSSTNSNSIGGLYGGGDGAGNDPTSAYYYGGGSGGSRTLVNWPNGYIDGYINTSTGYQGVCYILVPA